MATSAARRTRPRPPTTTAHNQSAARKPQADTAGQKLHQAERQPEERKKQKNYTQQHAHAQSEAPITSNKVGATQKAVLCEHNRRRSRCKACGGASICEHNRVRSNCKDCLQKVRNDKLTESHCLQKQLACPIVCRRSEMTTLSSSQLQFLVFYLLFFSPPVHSGFRSSRCRVISRLKKLNHGSRFTLNSRV